MSTTEVDADVGIVGYGPVGNALAILLTQLGRQVVVLERWPEPYPLPRAVHFDHEVGRIFQMCGIGAELRRVSEPNDVYEWRNAAGTTLLRFGTPGDGPSGWPASSMMHQPAVEAALDRRARDLGVEVRRGAEVTSLEQYADHVEVGGLRARYVVGCDGANSTVRSLIGLPVADLGFFYDWLIVDVVLDQPRVFDPMNLQICDPARPTTAVSGGPGRRRWEFMRLPEEPLEALHDEKRAWELLEPWDVHPGNATLERHAVYTFTACYAKEWRRDRVLIAGDAAHLMPPFAGQGLCSGMRDAANLAWKLDLVIDGRANDSLLDTYGAERMPSARAAIDFSVALGKVICVPDPDEAAARDEAMAAGVHGTAPAPGLPGLDTGLVHPHAPHAGTQLVQGTLGGRPLDDVHGNTWRVITIGDPIENPDWFVVIGGKVIVLDEPDTDQRRWFTEHDTSYALQRPDFYLYGTATTPDGGRALLDHLRKNLHR